MIEFNPDGSIKLPDRLMKQKKDNEFKMKNGLCATIKKEVISAESPKKCSLNISLSEKFTNDDFVMRIYSQFMGSSEVPSKFTKIGEREFEVSIGTCFSRCRDCTNLVSRFREFLEGNLIEVKGSCSFESNMSFCYEDHFD